MLQYLVTSTPGQGASQLLRSYSLVFIKLLKDRVWGNCNTLVCIYNTESQVVKQLERLYTLVVLYIRNTQSQVVKQLRSYSLVVLHITYTQTQVVKQLGHS